MVSQVGHQTRRDAPVDSSPQLSPKLIELNNIQSVLRNKPVLERLPPQGTLPRRNLWHIHNRWGLFAWIEFGLKIIGVLTAFISLTSIHGGLKISLLRVVEVVIIAPLVLGLILPLIASYNQKEFFNFLYVFVTFLGHVSVIFVLLYGNTGINLIIFCTMMAVGEFFRLVFIEATPVHKLPPTFTVARRRMLIGYVFFYIAVYLTVLAMETMTLIDLNREYINFSSIST